MQNNVYTIASERGELVCPCKRHPCTLWESRERLHARSEARGSLLFFLQQLREPLGAAAGPTRVAVDEA